jgi:hypothetical protein
MRVRKNSLRGAPVRPQARGKRSEALHSEVGTARFRPRCDYYSYVTFGRGRLTLPQTSVILYTAKIRTGQARACASDRRRRTADAAHGKPGGGRRNAPRRPRNTDKRLGGATRSPADGGRGGAGTQPAHGNTDAAEAERRRRGAAITVPARRPDRLAPGLEPAKPPTGRILAKLF